MTQDPAIDWPALVDELNRLLRLKTTPIGMKLFERVEDMQAVAKIRRPSAIHTADQIVAQAARLGFTLGITRDDLVGAQCGAVLGLHPQDADWLSGKAMAGVWFATVSNALHVASSFADADQSQLTIGYSAAKAAKSDFRGTS